MVRLNKDKGNDNILGLRANITSKSWIYSTETDPHQDQPQDPWGADDPWGDGGDIGDGGDGDYFDWWWADGGALGSVVLAPLCIASYPAIAPAVVAPETIPFLGVTEVTLVMGVTVIILTGDEGQFLYYKLTI
jgi:hypothetical protein